VDHSDANFVEQAWSGHLHERFHGRLELGGLAREVIDSLREGSHGRLGPEELGVARRVGPHPRAVIGELVDRQAAQLFAQSERGGEHQSLELVDRRGASQLGAAAGNEKGS
jgi:hypothetical protein